MSELVSRLDSDRAILENLPRGRSLGFSLVNKAALEEGRGKWGKGGHLARENPCFGEIVGQSATGKGRR